MSELAASQDIAAAGIDAELLDAKTPTEKIVLKASFEDPNYWQPDTQYSATSCVRPEIGMGFELVTTLGGRSGTHPPRIVPQAGAQIRDGSIVWTVRAITSASLVRVLQGDVVVTCDGLTISDQQTIDQEVFFQVDGGTAGTEYIIKSRGVYADGSIEEEYAVLPIRLPST